VFVFLLIAVSSITATHAVALANDTVDSQSALDQDWLFQAGGQPLCSDVWRQLGCARKLAGRLRSQFETLDLAEEVDELDRLAETIESQVEGKTDREAIQQRYLAVRAVKRRILLKHPAIDFSQLLCIDRRDAAFLDRSVAEEPRTGGSRVGHRGFLGFANRVSPSREDVSSRNPGQRGTSPHDCRREALRDGKVKTHLENVAKKSSVSLPANEGAFVHRTSRSGSPLLREHPG